jgi:creatinase
MSIPTISRPQFFTFENGDKARLPFTDGEYQRRLTALRQHMADNGVDAVVLTSMHNVAYYTGFLYCAFGRQYAAVVTEEGVTTLSANIDAGQPWRRCYGDNLVYTDWQRDNFWQALKYLVGGKQSLGVETDHLTLDHYQQLQAVFPQSTIVSISAVTMQQRMVKSAEEITLITKAAAIADIGAEAIHSEIAPGKREIDVAMTGRNAMEAAIASEFPDAEYRDTWVWFQSGLNTDGAHNPVTARKLQRGDILSLNTFPMISGYYVALERTLFVGEATDAELAIWNANVGAHKLGLSLVKPGVSCAEVCQQINEFFESKDLLQYRTFGYGHSFGVLSHYYGREAGLEFREDIDTVLQPDMVVSIEPMLTIPEGVEGAGGYREHDILVVTDTGSNNISGFPYGAEYNIVQY